MQKSWRRVLANMAFVPLADTARFSTVSSMTSHTATRSVSCAIFSL